jgi:hypothetical protein
MLEQRSRKEEAGAALCGGGGGRNEAGGGRTDAPHFLEGKLRSNFGDNYYR